jgi:hypothetical protein
MKAGEIINSAPVFWSTNRQIYLELCLKHINENPHIDAFRLLIIQDEIKQSRDIRHSKRKADLYLHDVLNRLNEMGISDAALPCIPLKKPRKSVLTKKEIEFVQSGGVSILRKYFWDKWLASAIASKQDYEKLFPFAIAFSSSCEAAFGKPTIHSMLSELKPSDLMANFSFRTKIHPRDESDKYSILYLPSSTQLLFTSFLLKKPEWQQQSYMFFPASKRKRRKYALDCVFQ